MIRRPQRSTRTDTLVPQTPRFRSARAMFDERVDQLVGHAGGPEATHHHRRSVGDVGYRRGAGPARLVEHGRASAFRADALLVDLRSEEHTSELPSLMRISYDVFCLKKKTAIVWQTSAERVTH